MRFTKIKWTKEGRVHLEYEVENKRGTMDEVSFTCSDEPRPEFLDALKDLAKDVIEMCELPEGYLARIMVTGVSFSYGGEKGVMGATITAQMKLHLSNVPLNLNTPHKIEEPYNEDGGDNAQLLSDDCVIRLGELESQARRYIQGVRAQGSLFGNQMKDGMDQIADDFHRDMQKGLGPGESVTISSGKHSATISGDSSPEPTKKVVKSITEKLGKGLRTKSKRL